MQRAGFSFLLFSGILWAFTTAFYIGGWDHVAAITTFPQWCWAVVGIVGALIAWRLIGASSRLPVLLSTVWLGTMLAFADNLIPIFRGLAFGSTPSHPAPKGTFRVATLNCASSSAAAAEVMQFRPDIVLLQECPPSNEVRRLARNWFGDASSLALGLDCAIISRYPLKLTDNRPPVYYTQATLLMSTNQEVLVTSLRFTPPLGNMNLWNPATWRAYLNDRRLRKRQLQAVLEATMTRPDLPQVMGGDFNAPKWDGIYKLLARFRDSHRVAGRGWGNTALNTLPIFRPDQIWMKGLSPVASHAVRTIHSDHRMVITDVSWKRN